WRQTIALNGLPNVRPGTPRLLRDPDLEGAHEDGIHHLEFSPDGSLLASSSADDTVKLWEMATGQPLCTVNLYSSAEPNPVFSPDGKTLAVATSEKTYLYQVAGPGPKTTVGHDHGVVRAFAFMPGTSRGGDLACFTEEFANSAHAEVVRW